MCVCIFAEGVWGKLLERSKSSQVEDGAKVSEAYTHVAKTFGCIVAESNFAARILEDE